MFTPTIVECAPACNANRDQLPGRCSPILEEKCSPASCRYASTSRAYTATQLLVQSALLEPPGNKSKAGLDFKSCLEATGPMLILCVLQ